MYTIIFTGKTIRKKSILYYYIFMVAGKDPREKRRGGSSLKISNKDLPFYFFSYFYSSFTFKLKKQQ